MSVLIYGADFTVFPQCLVGPGEQVRIPFSWRVAVEGTDSLSCRILTPTQLVEELSSEEANILAIA